MKRKLAPLAVLLAGGAAALGASSPSAPTTPIQHVVILMQENHSFANVLGFWCNQSTPPRCTGMPASVTLSDGTTVVPSVAPDIVPNLGHTEIAQADAIDGGGMNGWQNVSGCAAPAYACINGYLPSQVPNITALASTYAVADMAFTQADSPSWGGHLNEFAGTTDGFVGNNPHPVGKATSWGPGWGCDATNKVAQMLPVNGVKVPDQPSCVPDYRLGLPNGGAWEPTIAKHVPTIMDLMSSAGVSWKIYAQPTAGATDITGAYKWSGCPSFADCLDTSQDQNLVDSNQFFTDAANGTLPSVSFVIPAGDNNAAFSQHNSQSMAAGDNWIGKIASAVLNGPEASSTVLIVTYDDCGCEYDPVTPPVGPDGRQMGPRVPFVIAGAYVKPAYTDNTVTSSTGSILAFIEWNWNLPSLGQNDDASYNLSGDFNFSQAPVRAPSFVWQRLPAKDYLVTNETARAGT